MLGRGRRCLARLNNWPEDYEAVLGSISVEERKAPPSSPAWEPETYSSDDRSPWVTPARRRRRRRRDLAALVSRGQSPGYSNLLLHRRPPSRGLKAQEVGKPSKSLLTVHSETMLREALRMVIANGMRSMTESGPEQELKRLCCGVAHCLICDVSPIRLRKATRGLEHGRVRI